MKLNENIICIYIYIKIDKILFPTGKYHINKLHVTHLKILKLQMDETHAPSRRKESFRWSLWKIMAGVKHQKKIKRISWRNLSSEY